MSVRIACLMPTLPSRDTFRQRAIESLIAQVVPQDWTVNVYYDIDPLPTLGAKINRMMEKCDEPYVVLTDDDDFYHPDRIRRQVEPLLAGYDYSGTSRIFYHDVVTDEGWLYSGTARTWLGGLAFTRALWEKKHFQNITVGCDTKFQREVQAEYQAKFYDVCDPALFIASIHPGNACPKNTRVPTTWSRAELPPFPKLTEEQKK